MKSNEEKARELAIKSTRDVDGNGNEVYNAFVEAALLEMAEWKDSEGNTTGWHNLSDGDFPKITDDYLVVCRNKNKEDGIFLYEIAYYTGEGWENRTHWEDIIAWHEIPTYM